MSLFSDLDSHDSNPCNMWGRYSLPSTNAVGTFSDDPENDAVQLVTPPEISSPRTRSSVLRSLRKAKTIEIVDDLSKLRSNTDKNPKHFNAKTSNFTIPKTKKQTSNAKSNAKSPTKKNSTVQRKVPTQLELVPDAQGRAVKRSYTSENYPQRKLRRPWLRTSEPQGSDGDASVQQNDGDNSSSPPTQDKLVIKRGNRRNSHPGKIDASSLTTFMAVHIVDVKSSPKTADHKKSSGYKTDNEAIETAKSYNGQRVSSRRNSEETRCPLCNDIIGAAGCFTCPKTSDEELPFTTSDELSEDGFLVPAQTNDPLGFRSKTDEKRTENDEKTDTEQVNIVSSESQDSDCTEKTEVASSNITQDDIFCSLCGEARSKNGCGCSNNSGQHSTSKFYSRRRSSTFNRFGNKTLGGVSKVAPKRKRSSLSTKKKAQGKNKNSKQTILETSGEAKLEDDKKPQGKKKKVVIPQKPECVHISSDEEETLEKSDYVETNHSDDRDILGKSDSAQDSMDQEMEDASNENVTTKDLESKHSPVCGAMDSQECLDDFVTNKNNSVPNCVNGIVAERHDGKQKITEEDAPTFLKEDPYILLMVKAVVVGELTCTPREPVEVRRDKIHIKVKYNHENLDFILEKDDINSFKIHVEDDPFIVIMKTTPDWAGKNIKRYDQFKVYIDPDSDVYTKKHIIFILSEAVTGVKLDALVEMIDYSLCDKPVVQRISQEEANIEGERIISVLTDQIRTKSPESSQPSNGLNNTGKCTPVIQKTYSTRSRTSVIAQNKSPSKTILVYQPSSKLNGVTITSEDMLCLKPSIYLNDIIIDFFLKYLIEVKLTSKQKERLHLFSTFFYERLTQRNTNSDQPKTPTTMHRMVKSWTKNVDIFDKDFLVIPINESAHWFLVIICHPKMAADDVAKKELSDEKESEKDSDNISMDSDMDDFDKTLLEGALERTKKNGKSKKSPQSVVAVKERPCILIFDSLGTNRRSGVITNLRNYLNCEWKERKDGSIENIFNKDTIKGCYPKVPLQENFSDCGLYVLQYFESFFTNPIEDFKAPIDLRSWFPHDEMRRKRQDIIDVILELQAKEESLKAT